MSKVGQKDCQTQARMITLFRERLGYDSLGNWIACEDNRNIEETLLRDWLAKCGVSESLIAWALHQLGTQEMVHLSDRHHNDHFIALMNRFMPQWRLYRGYHPL